MKMKRFFFGCLFMIWAGVVCGQIKNQRDAAGHKQGYWEAADSKGKLVYSGYFKDDRPVGEMKRYYPTGGVRVVMNYDETGTKVRARFFWQNGELAAQGNYVDAKRDSVWLYYSYYAKTVSLRVEYAEGKRNGKEQSFYPDGTVAEETIWKNDLKDGLCTQYFENGQVKSSSTCINGQLEGAFTVYFSNGTKRIEGAYRHDAPDGEWKRYDEKGKLASTIRYARGIIANLDEVEAAEQELFRKAMEQEGRIKEPTIEDILRDVQKTQ